MKRLASHWSQAPRYPTLWIQAAQCSRSAAVWVRVGPVSRTANDPEVMKGHRVPLKAFRALVQRTARPGDAVLGHLPARSCMQARRWYPGPSKPHWATDTPLAAGTGFSWPMRERRSQKRRQRACRYCTVLRNCDQRQAIPSSSAKAAENFFRGSAETSADTDPDEGGVPESSFTVDAFMAPKPTRIDRVLTDRFSEPSRTYFQYLITQRAIQVNGRVVHRKSELVTQDDVVHVRFLLPENSAAQDLVPEHLPIDVLYEDGDILVVNKAADMVIHPAPGNWRGTLANALAYRFGKGAAEASAATVEPSTKPDSIGATVDADNDTVHDDEMVSRDSALRPGIVHRLDKGTSGVLVVAKHNFAERRLQRAFAQRQVYKEYLAVLAGTPRCLQNGPSLVELPIGRSTHRWIEQRVQSVAQGGRAARSRFEALAMRPSIAPLTLTRVLIETGRTHQIRVHARYGLQAPVLGDDLYGFPAWNQRYRMRARRPLLHAWRLGFRHPCTGKWCVFEAPLPEDFRYFEKLLQVRWAEVPSTEELRARSEAGADNSAPRDRI
jgi:23S rRNA pseudouridine1911/1915/1917 synthase